MPIYNLNNKRYNIPDDVVNDFERDNPNATIAYSADGNIYDIPVNKKEGFLNKYPNAVLYDDRAQQTIKSGGNTISGGTGTQEEADSLFELNRMRLNEHDPNKRAALEMEYKSLQKRGEEQDRQMLRSQLENNDEIKRLQEIQGRAQLEIDKSSFFDRFFNADTRAAVAARDEAEQALEMYSEANREKNGWFEKNVEGALRGFFDKVGDLRTWDFGASGVSSAVALKDAYEKLERGEQVTPAEQNMLDAYGLSAAVQAAYQDKVGMAYNVGGSLPESLAFGASLALNPAGGVGKKIAESAAKRAVKKYGTGLVSKLAKGAARVGGDIVEMGVATAVPGAGRVAEDYYNRLNGQATFDIDKNGIIRYGGQMEQEEADDAIWKAFGSQFIENYSESMGNYFAPMGNMLSNLTAKGLKAGGLGKLADAVSDISSSQWSKGLQRFKDAVKFDGLVGEYLEEVAGNVLNAATVGDMNFNSPEDPRSVFNPEVNMETFLSCALLSGTMYAVEAPITLYNKHTAKKNLREADNVASNLMGDRWADLRSQMDSASPEHLAQILTGVSNAQDLSDEQKASVMKYAERLVQSQGYNARSAQNAMESTPEANEAKDAYNEGSENDSPEYVFSSNRAMQKSGEALKAASEDAFNIVNSALHSGEPIEEFIEALDENVVPLAREYYNKSLKMRGVLDGVMDRAEDEIQRETEIIKSVTNPQTGIYTEINRLVTNEAGERVPQPGYVVGWIGEGENRMPTFLPEGVENKPENRISLKPTEFDASSIQELPMEEVISSMTEMIRERAKQSVAEKASIHPDVLNYTPINGDQVLDSEGKTLTATGVNADGVVYMTEEGNVEQMPLDAWKGLMQAQIEAQEAVQEEQMAAEQQSAAEVVGENVSEEIAPSETVGEQVNSGVNAEVNNPASSEAAPVQQAPVIPTKEDGSIDFVAYGKDNSFRTLGEKYGEKMPNKVAVTAKAFAEDLKKAQEKLAKAEEALDNAPIGREQKQEAVRDKAKAELEAVKREADFWADMDADIKAAQAQREAILNPQAEVEATNEPMTADEFIAQQLAVGNIVLNKDRYKAETGFGDAEANAMNGGAKKLLSANGMTIEEAGERLMEMDRENGTNFFEQSDANAGRDALIGLLGSVKSRKELNQFIANARAEQAKKESEGMRNELEKQVVSAHYESLEDFVLQMEAAEVESPFDGMDVATKDAIFAEAEEEYQRYLNGEQYGQGTTTENAEGSGSVLSEEQSDNSGGIEERQEQGNGVGERTLQEGESAHAGEQEGRLTQREGETTLQFAERVAEESRRKPLRERANEWAKALGVQPIFIESIEDAPTSSIRAEIEAAHKNGQIAPGWVSGGKVYFFLPDLTDLSEVDKTFIHEVVAHKGLKEMLGEERFKELCVKVWRMMSDKDRAFYENYPIVRDIEDITERHCAAADEYMAHLSEQLELTPEEKSVWDYIVQFVRDALDKALNGIIGKSNITDEDIAKLIKMSYANLKSGGNEGVVGEGTRFSAKWRKGQLDKASRTIRQWLKNNTRGKSFEISLPESTLNKMRKVMGRDFESHNITSNGIVHALKNHGENGLKLNEASIPLREEDVELIPYIMTAPDRVEKASTDASGRESVRFYKDLSNGYVVVVEKEYKNSPDDMETITMWAELSSKATNAQQNAAPDTHVRNAILSTDIAKIRKDAEIAIEEDENRKGKPLFRVVYHGSGAEFDKFDHAKMGTGAGSQVFGWGTYVTESKNIGKEYADMTGKPRLSFKGEFVDNEDFNNPWRIIKDLYDTNGGRLRDMRNAADRYARLVDEDNIEMKELWGKVVDTLKGVRSGDLKIKPNRNLYEVEIPDEKRGNYIVWGNNVTDAAAKKVFDGIYNRLVATEEYDNATAKKELRRELDGLKSGYGQGQSGIWKDLYGDVSSYLGSDKEASLFLHSLGYVGIKYQAGTIYQGDYGGAHNYVIFNEDDLQIVEHTRFRVSNRNQEIFVSNAQKAVEGIKQEKATPQQWLAMIEKNGGLKAGEDKWLGLSDWLKASDAKTLTKQEVLDFIGQNKIVIEEVHYEEGLVGAYKDDFEEAFWTNYVDGTLQNVQIKDEDLAYAWYKEQTGKELKTDENGRLTDRSYRKIEDYANKTVVDKRQINQVRMDYTTEGLINNHEIALTVPTIEPWNQSDEIHFGDAGNGRAVAWIRFGETTAPQTELENAAREANEALVKYQEELGEKYLGGENTGDPEDYADMMSDEERNHMRELVKTMRAAEENANANQVRVLVIDEIQSKRHQEGREKGYASAEKVKEAKRIEEEFLKAKREERIAGSDFEKFTKKMVEKYGTSIRGLSEEEEEEQRELGGKWFSAMKKSRELEKQYDATHGAAYAVPEAPFEKNWSELAMKRMLRYAAENGFDKVAWTKGAQQAERYNIGGVVSSIDYFLRGDGTYRVETYGSNGYQIQSVPTEYKDGQALAEVFGKELASKMVKDLEEDRALEEDAVKARKEIREKMRGMDEDSAEYEALLEEFSKQIKIQDKVNEGHKIEGDGLRVGGEGMKGFYDKMLPSFVNKYVKKWGTKVQDIELPNLEEAGRIMHSVDVTDAMKESVMEGQTMFRVVEQKRKDIQQAVDEFTSKYNSKPVTIVDAEMDDDSLVAAFDGKFDIEEVKTYMANSKAMGGYFHNLDRIVIFADRMDVERMEESLFHENIHAMIHHNNFANLVAHFYEYAKNEPNFEKWNKIAHNKEYKQYNASEEFLAYVVSNGMVNADLEDVKKYLGKKQQKALDKLLNLIGYDYDSRRRRIEQSDDRRGSSEVAGESALASDELQESGADSRTGEGVGTGKGRKVSERERAEKLKQLFDKVADMGLDGVLENKEYVRTMVEIFKALPEDVRTDVAEGAMRLYGGSVAPAVSDYLNHNADASLWDKVVAIVRDALRKVGFDLDLNTNEVKYLLWRSQKPLNRNSILDVAEDIDKKYKLKVGEYSSTESEDNNPDGGGTRFRVSGKLNVRDEYEATIKKGGYQAREAVQDAMLSLRRFQELIEKASGKKLRDFENAWMHENRLSSTVQSGIHEMERKFYKPMISAVKKLMKAAGMEENEVADYLMLKHGIERNREMAVRKALTDGEGKIDRAQLDAWYREKEAIRKDVTLDTWRKKQEAMDNAALGYGADLSRDYSGLTSMFSTDDVSVAVTDAYNEVENLENAHPVETEDLGKAIKAMTQNSLDKAFDSGLMDRKVYDELSKDMYDYYIPLRGFEETTSDEVYAYMDNERNAFNAPLKRAKGRSSKADNPIAYLKSIAESGIMQGERNQMKQTFLNLVMNNPSDLVSVREGVWAMYNPATDEWEAVAPPSIPNNATPADVERAMEAWEQNMEHAALTDPNVKKISEADDVPYRVIGNRMNQHQVIVKRLGKSYTLTINGNPRLAMALNGLTNPNNRSNDGKAAAYVASKVDALNRSLAAWYTTRNPDFVASNFMRDTFYTNTIVRAKEGNHYANHFHKHYAKLLMPGKMIDLFRKYENGTLDLSKPMERDFHEFMMNGGETGYSNLKDLEDIKKQISKELKGSRLEDMKKVAEKLDILNRAVENTARFAAYRTSKQVGRSVSRSIFDAKEISVNFNKKGSGGTFFGATGQTKFGNMAAMVGAGGRALYVFFNAAVQGTTNLLHVMKVNPKGTSAGLSAMFLMGAVLPYLFGGDDDEEKDYYDIPEHVRRNHLIVPGLGDAWVSIPLPIEYRIMYGMGELLTSWRTGHERGEDIARKMLNLTGQALPLNFLEEGLDAFMPSALSPIWQVYNNESWTGLPIYKDNEFNKDDPEYTKAYKNVDRNIYNFTKAMYEWTFDEENQKEGIDLNPAVIESLAKGYFGGLATQLSNTVKTYETIAGEREFDWRNIPVANRLFKTGDERTKEKRITNEYFENLDKLDFLQSRERLLKKTMVGSAVPQADKDKAEEDLKVMKDSDVYRKYMEFKKAKKTVDKIYKLRKTKDSPELEKDYYEALDKANKALN